MSELTDKQQAFVEEYLVCWNAAEAARRAGYSAESARSIGSENLTKPDIQAAIKARLSDKVMKADEVLARLSDFANASLIDFISFDDNGVPYYDLKKGVDSGKFHLVKKIVWTKGRLEI